VRDCCLTTHDQFTNYIMAMNELMMNMNQ